MRITNKIMQNNSLRNVNNTKVAQDTLTSQISSGKKIVRPSDDPIIAIRALRLRSSVTEITQYYSSNVPDAESWLNTTEDAISQAGEVLTNMVKQYTKGSSEYLTSSDRGIILEQLKALRDEVYSTGDADYAGRYVFTGYRTETSLSFQEDTAMQYEITEQLTATDLKVGSHVQTACKITTQVQDTDASGNLLFEADGVTPVMVNVTKTKDLADLQAGTQSEFTGITEQGISVNTYYRIRLSYKNTDGVAPVITYPVTKPDGNGGEVTEYVDITDGTDGLGASYATGYADAKSTDIPSPYDYFAINENGALANPNSKNAIIYLADTGELLLGENIYKALSGLTDEKTTDAVNEGEFRITYQKTNFAEGDLRPEHYFYCRTAGEDGTLDPAGTANSDDIIYNEDYLTANAEKQVIEYDVGVNQRLQVNTTANEVFDPGIAREIDDMIAILEDVENMENVVSTLTSMLSTTTDTDKKDAIQKQLDAASKAYSYMKENMQKAFESGISVMQGYLDQANVAVTNCGARGSRLELVKTRLCSQKTTFETLKSDNEDADISEVAVQLTSAELTYEAALKATAMMMKTNLMDFI